MKLRTLGIALMLSGGAAAAELPGPNDPRCVPWSYWKQHEGRITEHVYDTTAALYAAAAANPMMRVRYGFSRRERLQGFADAATWSIHFVRGSWDREHGMSVRQHERLHLRCPGWVH